jgi:hypothetical protein
MQVPEIVDLVTSEQPPMRYSTDDIVAAGRKRQRRRRAGWGGVGVAAVVAVVAGATAGVPALVGRHTTHTTPAVQAAAKRTPFPIADDPFTFTFKGYTAGKFHVQDPVVASTAYQIASVYEDGRVTNDRPSKDDGSSKTTPPAQQTLYAYLTLYRPGAFDPSKLQDSHRTTIDGYPAVEAGTPAGALEETHLILAWEYADNAWASVDSFSNSGTDPSLDSMAALVKGLKPAKQMPVTVPFRMSYVPAGYSLVETGTHATSGLNGIASAREGDYGGAIFAKPAPAASGLTEPFGGVDGDDVPGSFEIFVQPSDNSNERPPSHGTGPMCENGFCNVWTSDHKTEIQINSAGRLSNSEMTKILNGIHLADVKDDSTWPAASTALNP